MLIQKIFIRKKQNKKTKKSSLGDLFMEQKIKYKTLMY